MLKCGIWAQRNLRPGDKSQFWHLWDIKIQKITQVSGGKIFLFQVCRETCEEVGIQVAWWGWEKPLVLVYLCL